MVSCRKRTLYSKAKAEVNRQDRFLWHFDTLNLYGKFPTLSRHILSLKPSTIFENPAGRRVPREWVQSPLSAAVWQFLSSKIKIQAIKYRSSCTARQNVRSDLKDNMVVDPGSAVEDSPPASRAVWAAWRPIYSLKTLVNFMGDYVKLPKVSWTFPIGQQRLIVR